MSEPVDPKASPIKVAVVIIAVLAMSAAVVMLVAKKNPIAQATSQVDEVICADVNASTAPGTRAACAELAKEKEVNAAKTASGEQARQ